MTPEELNQDHISIPTQPRPGLGTILVSGASGYIGGRLVPNLLARGYKVRIMARTTSPELSEKWPAAEVVVGDALRPETLAPALEGVYAAYYLIHSLLLGPKQFESADITSASNFRTAAKAAKVKRIIYLGGLGDTSGHLSPHLRSRSRVATELGAGTVPVTILRAAIIIGSGSASYEILRHLVRNLLVFPVPKWARTRCQPISCHDVIQYLIGVLEEDRCIGQSYDIGGGDILSYESMLRTLAEVLGKRRFFVPVPFSNVGLYSYVTSLLTPVPHQITRSLMESSSHEVICRNTRILADIPFTPLSYKESIARAMSREEQDDIYSRWSNAYPPAHELAMKLREVSHPVRFIKCYSIVTGKTSAGLFASYCKIGGREGWFNTNWMWRLRGYIDRIFMGVGASRGRRSQSSLTYNDVIDFWRVEDIRKNKMLLLRAEMKLPGKAWLEFSIAPRGNNANCLSVTAYFDTSSLAGIVYWYAFLPFHGIIFADVLKQIDKRA